MLDLKHYACKNLTKYNILSLNLSNGFGQRFPVSLHSHRANSDQFPWQQSATFSFICILGDQVQVLLVWFMWNIVKKNMRKMGSIWLEPKAETTLCFLFFPHWPLTFLLWGFWFQDPVGCLNQMPAEDFWCICPLHHPLPLQNQLFLVEVSTGPVLGGTVGVLWVGLLVWRWCQL